MTRPPADVGMAADQIDTPALLVDLDAYERNLDRMAASSRGGRSVCARTPRRTSAR
jgi:D-serine deaminase-like pyridoxal phosphate-dependent protein